MRLSEVDDQEVLRRAPLLVYVSPGRYATLDASYSFPMPANMKR